MFSFKRVRAPASKAYAPGDRTVYQSECGTYRVCLVKRTWGIKCMPPYWQALLVQDRKVVQVLGHHRTRNAAEYTCRKHCRNAHSHSVG